MKREYEDEGLSVWSDGPFIALVWRAGPTEARVARLERVLETFARTQPNGFGILVAIGESAALPSIALRERIVSVVRRVAPYVKSVAWVVPSEGFQGSLVRSLLTALFVTLRPSFKPRAFQSLRDGLDHVLRAVGIVEGSRISHLEREIGASLRTAVTTSANAG